MYTHEYTHTHMGCLRVRGLTSSTVGHRSIAPGFKPRLGYVRRVFYLSLHLITFGGCSAHLTYIVHKSSCKTATFTHTHTHTLEGFTLQQLLIFTIQRVGHTGEINK